MAGALNAIWAVGSRGEFALVDGSLPWSRCAHLAQEVRRDMDHFKSLTWGSCMVMGFGTWRAMGRPLKGRVNVVVTHSAQGKPSEPSAPPPTSSDEASFDEVLFCPTLEAAIEAGATFREKVFLIGGKRLFESAFSKGLVTGSVWESVFDEVFPDATMYLHRPSSLVLKRREQSGRLTISEWEMPR